MTSEKNISYQTRALVMTALLAALSCVATLVIRIPSPTGGYMNLGDTVVLLGAYLLSSGVYDKYYYAAQKARTLITQDYDAAYAKVDTILMPASPRTAFKFGEISDPTQMYLSDLYTISLNICGNGGISVPLGLGEDTQLPVSAQLVGPAFKDRQLLTFARALERGFADAATGAPALSVAPDFAGKGGEL